MDPTQAQIQYLEDLALGRERGGHAEENVDLMIDNVVACLRGGRQIPDPAQFALPTRVVGRGYARSEVTQLIDLIKSWRQSSVGAAQAAARQQVPSQSLPRGANSPALRWSQAQLDWVREQSFRSRRGGYAQDDVDDLLDAVLVAMAHGHKLPDIHGATFKPSGIRRPGYDIVQVDAFLDELMAQRPEG